MHLARLNKFEKNTKRRKGYLLHIMAALAVSLLVVNAAFMFWPDVDNSNEGLVFDVRGQEVIQAEEILQTRQEQKKPPPPVPAPPVVMPDDVVLDDIELEISDTSLILEEAGNDTEVVEGTPIGNSTAARADRGPSPVRIVTPIYTRDANRRNIRAEIVVEVLVNDNGRVLTARIIGRYLLSKDRLQREVVTTVGYGLEESALAAAQDHTFRAAWENGKRVQSYTTLTFKFGF